MHQMQPKYLVMIVTMQNLYLQAVCYYFSYYYIFNFVIQYPVMGSPCYHCLKTRWSSFSSIVVTPISIGNAIGRDGVGPVSNTRNMKITWI